MIRMKYTRAVALIAIALCFFGYSNAQQARTDTQPSQLEQKVLIVYLSRTNNTKVAAKCPGVFLLAENL